MENHVGESNEHFEVAPATIQANGDGALGPQGWEAEAIKKYSSTFDGEASSYEVELRGEPLTVQAANHYLASLGVTSWAGFTISRPDTRLVAARWAARLHSEIEGVLTDSTFKPL